MKRKLLWVGDAAVASGFAKCTHEVLNVLRETWDVHVLGLNYMGDPHSYPYPIYPCYPGGDSFGLRRVVELLQKIRPDVMLIQNDPWNIPEYMKRAGSVPVIASMPVDGKNCRGNGLNGLALGIFWTHFGAREAQLGGYTGPTAVVPLGVNLDVYKPVERHSARVRLGLPQSMLDAFIVGNVNRNQPRKRLDLTIAYFADWIKRYKIDDAYLFLHVAPTGDSGVDVQQLCRYFGIANRLVLAEPPVGQGAKEGHLVLTYNAFDVQVNTAQGEGWGLTTMEGIACGIPQVVPDWAALGEWTMGGAALLAPCSEIAVTPNDINAIGGVVDRECFINCLHQLYSNPADRAERTRLGLELVARPQYRWRAIGERFLEVIDEALAPERITA